MRNIPAARNAKIAEPRLVTSYYGTRIGFHASGDGPPLVLVHGTAAAHWSFRFLTPLLADRFTVHALDRRGRNVAAYIESHIEQGPVLLEAGLPVGVVTSIAGATRVRVTVTGLAGHAGTVPMAVRRDALSGLAGRCPVPVRLRTEGLDQERLSPTVENGVYFVVAEALTNVAKHSGATRVSVGVWMESGGVEVRVEDDGVGGAHPAKGSGLAGLEQRVLAADGRLEISSRMFWDSGSENGPGP